MSDRKRRSSRFGAIAMAISAILLAGVVSPSVAGCGGGNSCDRDGCNAFKVPVPDNGQTSIGGVVALERDRSINGCTLCPLAGDTLSLWPVSEPVTDSGSASTIVNGGPAALTFQASSYYQQALDAGSYLLCLSQFCVNVNVLAGHLTPVNVLIQFGSVQFKVFDPVTHAEQPVVTLTTATPYQGS